MPEVAFSVDQSKSMRDQAVPGHNRWHPDIPAAASVKPGDTFRMECREWTDGQIGNNDSANDVRDVDLSHAHMLSGPIHIDGAEPGDLLVVDILDLGPVPQQDTGPVAGQGWGYTGIFAKDNAGGFLTDWYPDAAKAVWDFSGGEVTSRHLPGVRYTGITHPGLFGVAPSAELLARWNRREQALIDTDPSRVPALALPPLADNVLLGTLSGPEAERVAGEAARTVPARENGGNHDIKNLTKVLHGVQAGPLVGKRGVEVAVGVGLVVDADPDEREELGVPGLDAPRHEDRVRAHAVGGHPALDEVDVQVDVAAHLDGAAEGDLPVALAEVQVAARQLRAWHVHRVVDPRAPEEVRVLGGAGLPVAGLGSDRGPDLGRRRHPECLLHALPAHGDLRRRHPSLSSRADADRPG